MRVTWRSFARTHSISETTVAKATRDERLWNERGSWKVRGVVVKEALDDVGMKQFYELYDAHPRFVSCDECPHGGCMW